MDGVQASGMAQSVEGGRPGPATRPGPSQLSRQNQTAPVRMGLVKPIRYWFCVLLGRVL